MANLHISISAEPIFHLGNLPISNSILTSWLVSLVLISFALKVSSDIKAHKNSPFVLIAEFILESLLSLITSVTGSLKRAQEFLPLVASFFLFILLGNWVGLLPGVGTIGNPPWFRGATADLNTTLALALFSVAATQFFGFRYAHLGYFKKFFNFSGPIQFFVGILELISELAKILSFAFRLFGNIFAGEVLLVVIAFLLPLIGPIPFLGLEVFVGFIQALVFSLLTLVFLHIATITSHKQAGEEVIAHGSNGK
ncbi:MAG: F0F1 ATP synthase subunit A [Candidatus Chisholmbacteria bacterium]|nr:F0F1 ATP synthase subunit A [Candidatus Chisholmbacteria bacterium]